MSTKVKTAKPAAKSAHSAGNKARQVKSVVKHPKVASAKKADKKPAAKKPVSKQAKPVVKSALKQTSKKAIVKKAVANNKVLHAVKPGKSTPAVTKGTQGKMNKDQAKKAIIKPDTKAKPVPKATKEVKAKDIKVMPPKPVVLPKISTKTIRKYQPEFTKSVLDKAGTDPGAPTQRYSDSELTEFKELILRKLEAAKKELSYLHGLITRKDDMGGDETDNRYMTMEDGSLSMEREQLSQMASRQITFIDHLEKALMRIENKTYGICRITGRLIDKARLRAVPHATLSIEAKMGGVK